MCLRLSVNCQDLDEPGPGLFHVLVINADDIVTVNNYVRNDSASGIYLGPVRGPPADLLPHIFINLVDIFRNWKGSAALRAAQIDQLSAEHQAYETVTIPAGQPDHPLLSLEKQHLSNIP